MADGDGGRRRRDGRVVVRAGAGSGFAFDGLGEPVVCGDAQVMNGVLPVGGRLETGAHEARLAIADIGEARLGADTIVVLARTDVRHHQLVLERGRMHARVSAPPRLFSVATRSTLVTDLGCEYTIQVDAAGAGEVTVESGKIELEATPDAVVVAPAGTRASILPGKRPGLPLRRDASPALVAAAHAYERGTGTAAAVLERAGPGDAITIVALAQLDPDRGAILTRLADLAPPPPSVTIETARRDPTALAEWRDDIVFQFFERE
jgi:hypothetical protein